jgi:1,4-alpha-glucan branching enzyme
MADLLPGWIKAVIAKFMALSNHSMPTEQEHVGPNTQMGANVIPGGCSFRVWAPRAKAVYIVGTFNEWRRNESSLLVRDPNGYWCGNVSGAVEGDEYKFYVVGYGSEGFKRDPYARETRAPNWNCVIRSPTSYPWHDVAFRPPPFEDLIIYQLHVGTFYAVDNAGNDRRVGRVSKFLDVLGRMEYFVELGVTAIQFPPIFEYMTRFSLGYNASDLFSVEFDYGVAVAELAPYVERANALLAIRGHAPVSCNDIRGQADQLRLVIDVLHVFGIAVLFDVVYNHAGGEFGDESLYFFDRASSGNNNNSLYFADQGWAGGLVFAYWNSSVRQFLIDNAIFCFSEYHIDGLRYDEVSVIERFGGWSFCQDLTRTVRFRNPAGAQIAEFWNADQGAAVRPTESGGGGFDLVWHAGLRDAIRAIIGQAAGGRDALVDLDLVRDALNSPEGFGPAWRAVQMLENHDILLAAHSGEDRRPRISALSDSSNARSWYARSRSRVATGLLLVGTGIPLLFMGQEFLEDKLWSDVPSPDHLIWWDGLKTDKAMIDHLRFTRELIALRRRLKALRYGRINVFHTHKDNRVLAFHRWLEGSGHDVVVAASLNESTSYQYRLGFPGSGAWIEVFNSDVYDNWINPVVAGNGSGVFADGAPADGMPTSATVVLPANGLVVFARPG